MKLKSLHDLYLHELKDLYSAENQLVKAIPHMIKAANSPDLKNALKEHLEQTKGHVRRIEKICEAQNASPRGRKCVGMEGIIDEADELAKQPSEENVLDAGLIGAAQHAEHYEIAGYGTARAHAQQLGYSNDVHMLQETLDEESAANEKLTSIAESFINWKAEMANGRERQRA